MSDENAFYKSINCINFVQLLHLVERYHYEYMIKEGNVGFLTKKNSWFAVCVWKLEFWNSMWWKMSKQAYEVRRVPYRRLDNVFAGVIYSAWHPIPKHDHHQMHSSERRKMHRCSIKSRSPEYKHKNSTKQIPFWWRKIRRINNLTSSDSQFEE